MRYRLEVLKYDQIVVHNVETGLILGHVIPHLADHPDDPNRRNILACTVFNLAGDELAWISSVTLPAPLTKPAIAVANHERHYDFAGFRAQALEPCRPNRIEKALGAVLADICAVIALGVIECRSGGLESNTKERCIDSIVELHRIWYASRFGSFDDQSRRADDLYFSHPSASGATMSFAEAAQVYGMKELRRRFPQVSDDELFRLLAWPLDLLTALVDKLRSS